MASRRTRRRRARRTRRSFLLPARRFLLGSGLLCSRCLRCRFLHGCLLWLRLPRPRLRRRFSSRLLDGLLELARQFVEHELVALAQQRLRLDLGKLAIVLDADPEMLRQVLGGRDTLELGDSVKVVFGAFAAESRPARE